MNKSKYYQIRNKVNLELAKIELSSLAEYPVTSDDVLNHYSKFRRTNINVVYGSLKAHLKTKKWLKRIFSVLFNNRVQSKIFNYYIVITPKNSHLVLNNIPCMRTDGDKNPVKANKRAYSKLNYEIHKNNERKNTIKLHILDEAQEHTQSHLTDDNNHINLILMSNKQLTRNKLNDLTQNIEHIYAKENNISADDVSNNTQQLNTPKDITKVVKYMNENTSSLPYCKHIYKGQRQINKLKALKEPLRRKYLFGLVHTSKNVHQHHFSNVKGLASFINKYCVHQDTKKSETKSKPKHKETRTVIKVTPKPKKNLIKNNYHLNKHEFNMIKKMTLPQLKINRKMTKKVANIQIDKNIKPCFVMHSLKTLATINYIINHRTVVAKAHTNGNDVHGLIYNWDIIDKQTISDTYVKALHLHHLIWGKIPVTASLVEICLVNHGIKKGTYMSVVLGNATGIPP